MVRGMARSSRRIALQFIILSISLTANVSAGIRVVSDIDDTAKITNVGSVTQSFWNGLFSTESFTGMSDLYRVFSKERGYKFDYVSGAPQVIRWKVQKFLRNGKFPEGGVHLRPVVGVGGLRDYKFQVIKGIFDRNPNDKFILVGDDTQKDSDVYDDIFRYAPDRVLAIYIRRITDRRLPPSAYPFVTAFELARSEFTLHRLTVNQVKPVALSVINEKRDSRIMPGFSYCPESQPWTSDPQVETWNETIQVRLEKICGKRKLPRSDWP